MKKMYLAATAFFLLAFFVCAALFAAEYKDLAGKVADILFYLSTPLGPMIDMLMTGVVGESLGWRNYSSYDPVIAAFSYSVGGGIQYLLLLKLVTKFWNSPKNVTP